ncbi:MAG TPA: hypothetical protein VIA07_07090 [Desulfuromonadales bacterium]|jgi:hypothetical protein
MPWERVNIERLQRLFYEGFSVMDIAEPLCFFPADREAEEARKVMLTRNIELAGVLRHGELIGYVWRDALGEGVCGDCLQEFEPGEVVSDTASLAGGIEVLGSHGHCFVEVFGQVSGVIGPNDLEKPQVRIYLFGLITLVEEIFGREIRRLFPADSWRSAISPGRLQKAEELRSERQRRGQSVDLVDCLQFSDKGQIMARLDEFREELGMSKRDADRAVKELEVLRNNLAHSQKIVNEQWRRIPIFSSRIDRILSSLGSA